MKFAVPAAFALFLLAVPANAQAPAAGESVLKQHFDLAQKAQASGHFDEAARQYRIFIADALAQMALASVSAGTYPKAVPLFNEALTLAPNSPGLKLRYAQAAYSANDLTRSLTLAEGILHDDPGNAKAVVKAHFILGQTLSRMNQEKEAREHFEAAVALDPSFENGYALAIACLDLGDGDAAGNIFAEMIAGLGDTAPLHVEIGRAYLNSDFQQKAAPEFARAIALDPRLPGAHYGLAVAALTAGGDDRLAKAQAALEAELTLSPNDPATHAQLGNLALQQHRPADAERELLQAGKLDPSDPNPPFYLGQLYAEQDKPVAAIAALTQSIHLTRDPAYNRYQVQKAHYQLGRLLLQSGQADAGRQQMQISSTLLKRSLSKDRNRLAGDYAEDSKDKTADAPPTSPTPQPTPATKALADLEARLAKPVADSYNNLAIIAAEDRHPAEALTAFARAYQWNPALPGLDPNWGLAAYRAGQYPQAIPPLTRALAQEPANPGIRAQLAVSLYRTQQYQAALNALQPLTAQVEATPELALVSAASQLHTGDTHGLTRLEHLEHANPELPEVHQELAAAYRDRHQSADAEREQALFDRLNRATEGHAQAVNP